MILKRRKADLCSIQVIAIAVSGERKLIMSNLFERITMITGIAFFGSWCVMGAIFYIIAIVDAILN